MFLRWKILLHTAVLIDVFILGIAVSNEERWMNVKILLFVVFLTTIRGCSAFCFLFMARKHIIGVCVASAREFEQLCSIVLPQFSADLLFDS